MGKIKRGVYKVLRCLITTKQWEAIQDCAFHVLWDRHGGVNRETYDDYSATTAMVVESLIKSGLPEYKVLSVTGRIGHLIPLVPMFSKVVHCTMIPIERKDDIADMIEDKIVEYIGDFFDIPDNDSLFKELNVVISHATIHCMNDTRYLNLGGENERPYRFAEKLCRLCPNMKYVIASVDVAKEEHMVDNNAVLSDDKFINSFIEQGFHLEKKLYDKFRTMGDDYHGKRFSSEYPEEYCKDGKTIIATYIFSR